MTFELLPILDKMCELYEKPANIDRFNQYLQLLIGDTDNDLATPIGAYNPMAKEHVLHRLNELRELKAEVLVQDTLAKLNKEIGDIKNTDTFKVALCLSDDLKGGWTNRYTSDYD